MDLSNENVIHVKKGNVEYLQFRKLLKYSNIINHAYSLGIDVNFRTERANKESLPENEYKKALEDYKEYANAIGSNYKHLVKPNQMHTDIVKNVSKKINIDSPDIHESMYESSDGLITNKKALLLATTNADCILLLLFDPIKKIIANVHSGWRGTIKRISVKAVEKMIKEYECNAKDIICCICPSIRKCHFEVDKDVKDMFKKEFQDLRLQEIIKKQENKEKWNIDTVQINKEILEKEGLQKENIIDSKICSVCNSNLVHSCRAEKEGFGLGTALIELK